MTSIEFEETPNIWQVSVVVPAPPKGSRQTLTSIKLEDIAFCTSCGANASLTYPKTKGMADADLQDFLKFLVGERDAIFDAIRLGKYIAGEWGTDLDESPPTTIDFVFPCRKLVKSDEDLWTFPAGWVLRLIVADLLRRNDPEAKDFRDHVAYFYPEVQPAFWSTIGTLTS